MPHGRGGFGEIERRRNFLIRQLFVITHQYDFAIGFVQFHQDRLQFSLQFLLNGGAGGRHFLIDKLSNQLNRRGLIENRAGGLFAIEAAASRPLVPPMGIDDSILGHVPQPKRKRHPRIAEIVLNSAVRVEENLLHDVAGIFAACELAIKPQIDRPPQRIAA